MKSVTNKAYKMLVVHYYTNYKIKKANKRQKMITYFGEDGFEQAGVGVEAARVQDGVLAFVEVSYLLLQVLVDGLSSAYESDCQK